MAGEQMPLIESPRYEIRTIGDFLKVPAHRLAACLREFALCVRIQADLMVILTPPEHPGSVRFDRFTWIDDGKREISVTLETPPSVDAVDPVAGRVPD